MRRLTHNPLRRPRLVNTLRALGDDAFQAMSLHKYEHVFRTLVGHLRESDVIVSFDGCAEDLASLRERRADQIFASPHQHIECIEDDVRLSRSEILQKIKVWLALLIERHNLAVDYSLIRQSG
jgi:hypothetical protein